MALERTFSIVKPDAVAKNKIGEIYTRFESEGLKIIAASMLQLNREKAEGFYAEHNKQPFFGKLVEFMISGPIMIQVLEGKDAVLRNREIMGATNPKEALPGTLRAVYGSNITKNAVHGSDSLASAVQEIQYFFSGH